MVHYHANESTVSHQDLAPKRVSIVLINFAGTLFAHLQSNGNILNFSLWLLPQVQQRRG